MYKRLIKIKKRLDKVALRDPRTNQQKIDRNNIMHGKMPRIRTGKLCGTGN